LFWLIGRLAASLIRDFLECCNLDYTISVLDPELNSVSRFECFCHCNDLNKYVFGILYSMINDRTYFGIKETSCTRL